MNAAIPRICPRCGKPYAEATALSREDPRVEICPACGTAEALEAFAFAIGKIGFDSPPQQFTLLRRSDGEVAPGLG
jgi:hypothetical protein